MVSTKVILVTHEDLSVLPATTKSYAIKAIGISRTQFANWIRFGRVTLDESGMVPFSEVMRLRKR